MSTLSTPSGASMPLMMSDLLAELGDISPDRVRLRPAPGTATEQDILDADDHEDRLFELVDGVMVEKTYGMWESVLETGIGAAICTFVYPRKLGIVMGAAGPVRLGPGLVRMPNINYIARTSMPGGKFPDDAIAPMAPDIAVEVLSKSNTRREMERKRKEYFGAGTKLVWEFDPKTRTVKSYFGPEQFTPYTENDTLPGDPVLPGFSLNLSELFAQLAEL